MPPAPPPAPPAPPVPAAPASACLPVVTRSDLASAADRDAVRTVVHQALLLCRSHAEVATYCQLALARHFGEAPGSAAWCAAVGSSPFQSR